MNLHKVAYIDEDPDDIDEFQRQVYGIFDVDVHLPEEDMGSFISKLLQSEVKAYIADFRLNEFKTVVSDQINYNGVDLVNRILEIRKDFPCFVLTSFDGDAIQASSDVNYIYPKEILSNTLGEVTFAEKIRIQIEHYESKITEATQRFHTLLAKRDKSELTGAEKKELLKLDTYLEQTINHELALTDIEKSDIAFGKIEELIDTTKRLISELQEDTHTE